MANGSQKTYQNVSSALFGCIKTKSKSEHGTVYDPPNGNQGTATTKVSFIGTIVLGFVFDPGASTLAYTIQKKPGVVLDNQIWNGIQSTIDECR
jgi:hypothetical protein